MTALLFAPYDHSEAAVAAFRLLELGCALGCDIELVAVGPQRLNVHEGLGGKVISITHKDVWERYRKADRAVWFSWSPAVLNIASLVNEHIMNFIVPSCGRLRGDEEWFMRTQTSIICPSTAAHIAVLDSIHRPSGMNEELVTWARWEAGLPFTQRDGRLDDQLKVLYYCDAYAIDDCPHTTLGVLEYLLERFPSVDFTFWSSKSWGREDRRRIAASAARYGERLRIIKQAPWTQLPVEIQMHDWVLCPSPRSDFAYICGLAAACGAPVVAYDVSPFDEFITHESNGLLARCDVMRDRLNHPVALPTLAGFIAACERALGDRGLLLDMQTKAWAVNEHRQQFENFWARTLVGERLWE